MTSAGAIFARAFIVVVLVETIFMLTIALSFLITNRNGR
jgi:F0F1-type ATP synthase membrane subunit c/vacuolar-type H+-ATPase subunit K